MNKIALYAYNPSAKHKVKQPITPTNYQHKHDDSDGAAKFNKVPGCEVATLVIVDREHGVGVGEGRGRQNHGPANGHEKKAKVTHMYIEGKGEG